jgi:uncharacterized RDD family membrane protein YckC
MEVAREYVGFWPRVLAAIIDSTLLAILMRIVSIPFAILLLLLGSHNPEAEELTTAIFLTNTVTIIINIIISFSYYLILWSKKQATLGKMAIHAIIIDAKTGGKPSTGQLVGRYFALTLSALPLCLGYIWVAFDEQKRGWHDILAGTLVVKKN